MKLGKIPSHPNSVKAIAGISAKHLALLEEYRMALSLWSETRAIYSPEPLNRAFGPAGFLRSFDLRPELARITAPTLILWGKYDQALGPPERTGERLHRDISGSRLVVIDNAGHLPQLERPEEFNRIVRQFLKTGTVANAP